MPKLMFQLMFIYFLTYSYFRKSMTYKINLRIISKLINIPLKSIINNYGLK